MGTMLLATDAAWVRDEIIATFDGLHTITVVDRGQLVTSTTRANLPDLVVLDMQIGNMGGIASCMDLRNEESVGRLPRTKVILLLDREADLFLAQRCDADGWLVKPLDSLRLKRAAAAVLAGDTYREGVPGPDRAGVEPTPAG